MANMEVTDRNQYERTDLSVPSTGVKLRSSRPLVIYTLLAVALLGVLAAAAIAGIEEWWQGVVFGVIVLTTIGLMIAVSPSRRA